MEKQKRIQVSLGNVSIKLKQNWISEVARGNIFPEKLTKDIFLIKNVSFSIPEGSLFAILGGSGSGKTTLLNVIAGRYDKLSYDVQGIIKFGSPSCSIGYVTQNDYLLPNLTVRETLLFTARLKVDSSTLQDKNLETMVMEVLLDLGLKECMDSRIGDMNMTGSRRGISGGEKRRVSVALQIITSPQVLCADEPTSGLDSFTAITVMESLKRLTDTRNTTVVCSVHQPRADIFNIFDYALILSKGGNTLFCGPTTELVPYFGQLGYDCPVHANPADFFIDLISVDNSSNDSKQESLARIDFLVTSYQSSSKDKLLRKSHFQGDELPLSSLKVTGSKTSWFYQVLFLINRFVLNEFRDTSNIAGGISQSIILSVVCMAIFWNLPNDSSGISSRVGLLYIDVSMENYMLMVILIERYCRELKIFDRELQDELYHPSAYYIAHIISNIPLLIIITICFSVPLYFGSNMRSGVEYFLVYALTNFAMVMVINGLVWMSVAMDRRFSVASLIGNITFTFVSLAAGFLVNYDSIPIYVRWVKDISFLSYGYRILMDNEFNGRTYQLCSTVDIAGNNIEVCSEVPGSTILSQYSVTTGAYKTSWPIMIFIGLIYFTVAGLLLHYLRFPPTGSVVSDLTLQGGEDDDEGDDMFSRYSEDDTTTLHSRQPGDSLATTTPTQSEVVVTPMLGATEAAIVLAEEDIAPSNAERSSFNIDSHNPIDISTSQQRSSLKSSLLQSSNNTTPKSTTSRFSQQSKSSVANGASKEEEEEDADLDEQEDDYIDEDEDDEAGKNMEEGKDVHDAQRLEDGGSFNRPRQATTNTQSITSTEIRMMGGVVVNVHQVDLFVRRPTDLLSALWSSSASPSNGESATNSSSKPSHEIRESDVSSSDFMIRPSEGSMKTAAPKSSTFHRPSQQQPSYVDTKGKSETVAPSNAATAVSTNNTSSKGGQTPFATSSSSQQSAYKQILHNVSVEIRPGKLVAIMGGSGSGKSTLLNLIANRIPQNCLIPRPHVAQHRPLQYPMPATTIAQAPYFFNTFQKMSNNAENNGENSNGNNNQPDSGGDFNPLIPHEIKIHNSENRPIVIDVDDHSVDPHYKQNRTQPSHNTTTNINTNYNSNQHQHQHQQTAVKDAFVINEASDAMYQGRGGIYFNARVPSQRDVRRLIGYVQQFDFHLPSLTVQETLLYQAKLRLKPPSSARYQGRRRQQVQEKQRFYRRRSERVMKLLGLRAVRHVRVGDDDSKGISGGEKRRLSIGIQLLSNPAICLLDEPTTGLDAFTARKIVLTLRDLVHGKLQNLYQSNASRENSRQDPHSLFQSQQNPSDMYRPPMSSAAAGRHTDISANIMTMHPSFASSSGGAPRDTTSSGFGNQSSQPSQSTASATTDRKTVILSIHQPRYDIFAVLDEVILLSRGLVVWAGSSEKMLQHFSGLGYACPALVNPADFILDLSSIDFRSIHSENDSRDRLTLLVQAFRDVQEEEQASHPFIPPVTLSVSPPSAAANLSASQQQQQQRQQRVASTNTWRSRMSSLTMTSALLSSRSSLWSNSNQSQQPLHHQQQQQQQQQQHLFTHRKGFCTTYAILLHRAFVNLIRQPALLFNRVTQCLFYALILACFYSPLGDDQISIQNRIGLLYELTPLCFIGMLNCIAIFPTERGIFLREYVDGVYPAFAFLAAYFTIALPIVFLGAACIGILTTCATGLTPTLASVVKFTYVIFLFIVTGESVGVAFCMAFEEIGFAVNIMSAIFSVFSITAGFISLNMPQFLVDISYLSPLRWGAYILANVAFEGETFVCGDDDVNGNGQTCELSNGADVLSLYGFTGQGSMNVHYLVVGLIALVYFVASWMVFRWRAYTLSH